MNKLDDFEEVFHCADGGRELTYAQTQFRYLPSGCGREPVCRDDRTCEPTMAAIVKQMDKGARHAFKSYGRVYCHS